MHRPKLKTSENCKAIVGLVIPQKNPHLQAHPWQLTPKSRLWWCVIEPIPILISVHVRQSQPSFTGFAPIFSLKNHVLSTTLSSRCKRPSKLNPWLSIGSTIRGPSKRNFNHIPENPDCVGSTSLQFCFQRTRCKFRVKLFSRPGRSKSSMAVSCKMLKKPEKSATAVLMVAPWKDSGEGAIWRKFGKCLTVVTPKIDGVGKICYVHWIFYDTTIFLFQGRIKLEECSLWDV